jgi:guanylate kinase
MAACSGTGKGTVGRRLRARNGSLRLSVSHTTRAPRPGEVDGVDYHFVDQQRFSALVEAGEFLEWADYAGNRYGTARAEVERARAGGYDLLFDIEVVGAANIKTAVPSAVSVFLLPPSWSALEARLRGRGTESEDTVRRRLEVGRRELDAAGSFDHLVVNDDLDRAVGDLEAIYRAAALRTADQSALLTHIVDEAAAWG